MEKRELRMEEDARRNLVELRKEVGKISEAIVRIAEQDQKIVHLFERQARVEKEMNQFREVVMGPDGILVRLERVTTRMMVVCTAASAVMTAVVSTAVLKIFS